MADRPHVVDDRHMVRAIELAQKPPRTHPNPRVGAVVVTESGVVVGEGFHPGVGEPHAEIYALNAAGSSAAGSSVYVTLEPCAHHGETPPCVDALVEAGVTRVVVATSDPDSRVAGEGVRRLEDAGIEVVTGVLEELARSADPAYFHHRETDMPLVVLKWAMTLDGSVAAADGTSQWITSEAAREHAHELRAQSDAVVVGAGTLRNDDPLLTVRGPAYEDWPQPRAVVVAGHEPLPADARIWSREPLVVSPVERDIPAGELVVVSGRDGHSDPVETCRALADRGLIQLLLEGGPALSGSWWDADVVTHGVVFVGAKMGGGVGMNPLTGVFGTIDDADVVSIESVRNVGKDVLIVFEKK